MEILLIQVLNTGLKLFSGFYFWIRDTHIYIYLFFLCTSTSSFFVFNWYIINKLLFFLFSKLKIFKIESVASYILSAFKFQTMKDSVIQSLWSPLIYIIVIQFKNKWACLSSVKYAWTFPQINMLYSRSYCMNRIWVLSVFSGV